MALLHEDLVAIRSNKQLKQADIYDKTRIPQGIIDEIERGTIFTNKSHQLTYIRSYVRSYAKAVGIHEDHIIQALDEQQNQAYSGVLAEHYLSSGTSPAPSQEQAPAADEIPYPQETTDQSIPASEGTATATKGGNEYSRPDPNRTYNKATPPPPEMESVDWAGVGKRVSGKGNKIAVYTGLAAAVLLSAGLFYYLLLFTPEEESVMIITEEQTIPIETPAAEMEEELAPEPVQPEVTAIPPPTSQTIPSAPVRPSTTPVVTGVLPDTVGLVIHAYGGKLEPVRVTSDINNMRSPYWIETSEGMRFEFLDNITIEGQITRMAVWVNGHHFADLMEFATGSRTIELTRDALSQYAELFSSPGEHTSESIDSPTVINDRPLF